jgi:hypothetical protein
MPPRASLPVTARRPLCSFALAALLAALAAGCDSDADTVCGDIANCSHGGSDDWSTACREQAVDLSHEATRSGCGPAYEAYFACADDHFACRGNQSSFPGCDAHQSALATCLEHGRSSNACGELDARLSACGAPAVPPSSDGGPLEPCTTGGVCSARCYLSALPDVCTPSAAELAAFADCASHCVP